MTTSETTTGELIEALRCDGVIKSCEGCFFSFQIENCAAMGCRTDDMFGLAADRLESLEQKLELLNGGDFDVIDIPAALAYLESVEEILPHASALIDMIQSLKGTAIELTARAEQAERERDVLKLEFATIEEDGLCSVCKFESSIPLLQCMEDCCFKHRGLSILSVDGVSGDGTERRGQPQDGEGK
jgi:hypothetical protein